MAPRRTAQVAITAFLLLGCALVLLPFGPAILFAGTVCITTWPLFAALERRLRRSALAAGLTTLGLSLLLLVPIAGLSLSLGDAVGALIDYLRGLVESDGLEVPVWLQHVPLVGESLTEYAHKVLASQEELRKLALLALEPARRSALTVGALLGQGVLQLLLVLFILYFCYRDGRELLRQFNTAARYLGGELGISLLALAGNTVKAVMIGIVGTAAAQALVALVGFVLAGVPGALLLGAATFFLSLVPVGPPLVWGGAAFWLYQQGQPGWAVFMVLWGTLVVSSVDNFLKPILISRSASLPLVLIALGAFGGVLAFGFIGLFLGPSFLAVGKSLFTAWTAADPAPPVTSEPTNAGATASRDVQA